MKQAYSNAASTAKTTNAAGALVSSSNPNLATNGQQVSRMLTTQDKFSMFTQKHVKQAKKQEYDQKA